MNRRSFFSLLLPAAVIADPPKEKCVEPKNVNVSIGGPYFCECGFAVLPSEWKPGQPRTFQCVNGNCGKFGVVFDLPTLEATEHRNEAQLKACDEVREGETIWRGNGIWSGPSADKIIGILPVKQ